MTTSDKSDVLLDERESTVAAIQQSGRRDARAVRRAVGEAAAEVRRLIEVLNTIEGNSHHSTFGQCNVLVDEDPGSDDYDHTHGVFDRLFAQLKVCKEQGRLLHERRGIDVFQPERWTSGTDETKGSFDRLFDDEVTASTRKDDLFTEEDRHDIGQQISNLAETATEIHEVRTTQEHDGSELNSCFEDQDCEGPTYRRSIESTDFEPCSGPTIFDWQQEYRQARTDSQLNGRQSEDSWLQTSSIKHRLKTVHENNVHEQDIWFREVHYQMYVSEPDDRRRPTLRRRLLHPILLAAGRLGALADSRDDNF